MSPALALALAFAPGLLLLGSGRSRSTPTAEQQAASATPNATPAPAVAAPSSSAPRPPGRGSDDEFSRPRPPNDHSRLVRLSQVLIAYRGAEHAPPTVTRTQQEAKDLAGQVGLQARVGTPFEDLVKNYSDDPSAATNHGDLGKVGPDQLPKPLAAAAFRLFKEEVESEPVETPAGFHILKRTE